MEYAIYLPYGIRECDVCRWVDWVGDVDGKDVRRIHLLLNSGGGSVGLALAIASIIDMLPIEVWTYNIGNVDSAAAIVFAAGRKRICLKSGTFSLHPVGKEISGVKTADELLHLYEEIKADELRVCEFINRRLPSLTVNWRQLMADGTRITAEEAVRIGLADNIGEIPKGVKLKIPIGS